MNIDLKKAIEKANVQNAGFIKTNEKPNSGLTSEQKVILNRKGNVFFNQGDIEQARRIFMATGYSDGLTRVADTYFEENRELDALKLYILAHNKRKTEPLMEKLSKLVSLMLE
ncbi:MAG: hypothetical protein J6B81_02715 [Spirochaetaceae bacterium]|nr:hypothetical protein [Spirochaetaceae bacterium]